MAQFAFVFHGGTRPESPEEAERVMAEWTAWFASMGAAVVEGGGPAGPSKTVSVDGIADDGGPNPVSGLSIVEALDHDAAADMARGCPMVKDGTGTVEVVEILEM